jgi:hypothetical protein
MVALEAFVTPDDIIEKSANYTAEFAVVVS